MGFLDSLFGRKPKAPAKPESQKDHVSGIDDADLGRLEWNPELALWEGSGSALGDDFDLMVSPQSAEDRAITDEARRSFARVFPDLKAVFTHAVASILPEFNEHWSPEDPFSHERLSGLLYLTSIVIEPDGYLEVEFSDGSDEELLGGHCIVSRFYPDGTREVVIEG